MASDETAPQPETTSSRRAWQGRGNSADPRGRGDRRRSKVLIITGLLAGLGTLVIVLFMYLQWPQPSPHFLAINVAEHNRKHFPVQAFARADSALLMRHFEDKKTKEATTRSRELLRSELKDLRNRSTDPIVIHFTAQALVRGDSVMVLPADADPDDEDTWLNVNEVVDAVKECPSRHRLLILDLAHGVVEPRLGITVDRVAETLEKRVAETVAKLDGKDNRSFLILCPCSAGQTSLTSEVLRTSVLAFYLDQGLRGPADMNDDGITVKELVEFVKPRVDLWARNNRGVRQEPRLFGKGDFIVSPLGRPKLPSAEIAGLEAYPKVLLDAWKKRDEFLERGALQQFPRLMLRLEANLMRDENRWRGGLSGKETLDAEASSLLAELANIKAAAPLRLPSLVTEKENELASAGLLSVLRQGGDPKKALAKIADILKDAKADFRQQVRIIADALSQLPEFTKENLTLAKAAVDAGGPKEPLIEVAYLDRLAAFAERELPENFERANATILWGTMREREAALAALAQEPEHVPSVAGLFENAEKTRRVAEARIFWKRPPEWAAAQASLKASAGAYDAVRKSIERVRIGSLALDRALAELPPLALAICEGLDADPVAEQNWLKAAEETAVLLAFFSSAPEKRNLAETKPDTRGRDIEQCLDDLHRSLQLRKNADVPDSAVTQRQLACLLQYPRLKAAERADLVNRFRAAAKKLHDETDKNDVQVPNLAPGSFRAKVSLALLRVGGIEADEADPPPAANWKNEVSTLEKRLAECWGTKGLVKRWREHPNDRRGDAMSRLVSPWDSDKEEDQNRARQDRIRADFVRWLKENVYRAESLQAGPLDQKVDDPRDQGLRDFYRNAAK